MYVVCRCLSRLDYFEKKILHHYFGPNHLLSPYTNRIDILSKKLKVPTYFGAKWAPNYFDKAFQLLNFFYNVQVHYKLHFKTIA